MTSFVADDLTIEMERYLKIATEVCIATAFVNFEGVKLLKQFVEKTRQTRPYTINFLLDQEFHPHPAAREAIIRQLCEIPGAKVRVFTEDDRRLHMKVYIFSAGNTVSVIAGSHNATSAGMAKNIEAGLLTSNRQAVRDAREYFNNYWSKAQEAIPNPEAWYEDPRFQPGHLVRHRRTNDCGVIAIIPRPEVRERSWYYHVLWTSQGAVVPTQHQESELRAMTVVETERSEVITEKLLSESIASTDYVRALLSRKLSVPVRNGLFSYMSSRTDVIPYQFKPLLKILASDSYRILIADEVGLGKTIEAGIIFTELKARFTIFNRVLIVCPTNLKTKWKDEMESRFDEYFKLLTREEFLSAARNPKADCFGIISYEFLGHDEMIEFLKETDSHWDMVILDEAHHLRNKNKRHRAVAHITRRVTALVMLSATPVNLGLNDLTHLLQLLLPHDYRDVDDVEFGHRLAPNKYLFEALDKVDESPGAALAQLREMERSCKYANRVVVEPAYQRVQLTLGDKDRLTSQEMAQVKDDLISLNALAKVVSRTRKSDVGVDFPREVITAEVEFSPQERLAYEALTSLARTMAGGGKSKGAKKDNSLAVMMPQRQAASCLSAALDYTEEMVRTRVVSTDDVVGEIEDSEDEGSTVNVASATLMEAQTLLKKVDRDYLFMNDTKYRKLKEFLRTRCMTAEGRLDKVLIFTSFRKTLAYLQRRLEDDFGRGATIEIHGEIQPLTERDARRARFEAPGGPSILLCTEVGSEGLDMQFANKLVNYDLPWNPMRVEQRIGRIDRYGQKAEKLMVLNFCASATIEDNVVARLVERVKVFRDSLGPLNQVVGRVVQQIKDDLLNPSLTDDERAARVRQYEIALMAKERQAARFQEARHQLMGQDKNFAEDISGIERNRRFVTPVELLKVVEMFSVQYPDEAGVYENSDGSYLFTVKGEAQRRLIDQVRSLRNVNDVKRKRYLTKLMEGSFQFTTDRAVAVKRKDIEFFTLHHPVVTSIVSGWSDALVPITGRFGGSAAEVPPGSYLLFTYYCEFDRKHLQPAVYVYNMAVDASAGLITHVGEELYHLIVGGTLRPISNHPSFQEDVIERANRSVQGELTKIINQAAADLQRDREVVLRQRAEVIQTSAEKEVAALSLRRKFLHDNRSQESLQRQIEERKAEAAARVSELSQDLGDVTARPLLVGVAWCQVSPKEG